MIGRQLLLTLRRGSGMLRITLTHHAVQHETDNKAQQDADDCEKKVISGQFRLPLSVLEQPANFFSKFRTVCVAMMRDRVLNRRL
jgi:hypothetical protein